MDGGLVNAAVAETGGKTLTAGTAMRFLPLKTLISHLLPLLLLFLPPQKWVNTVGKAQKRKGKRLFMPMRIALTGRMQGADVGEQLEVLSKDDGNQVWTSVGIV